MLTYLFGWDLFGVFIGINRSIIMDITIILMMFIEQYMLFNKKMCKNLYGTCCLGSSRRRIPQTFMEKTLSDELSNEETSLNNRDDSPDMKKQEFLQNGVAFNLSSLPRISGGESIRIKVHSLENVDEVSQEE